MESTLSVVGRRTIALVVLIACGSMLTWAAVKGPDAGGYTVTDESLYSFVDVSGASGGASLLAGTDDGTAALTLPFPVRFYGQTYPMACVSTNGALYLVASVNACSGFDADFANNDVTAVPVPNDVPALLPFWSDLTFQVPGAGAVFYQTLGAAPSRRFVVQWHQAYPQGSPNPVTFQVVLGEGLPGILFQYQQVELGGGNAADRGGLATIGIRNAGAVTTGQRLQWSDRVPVIQNRTALLFTMPDAAPPVVTASATPSLLWPPNGKAVAVVVRGTISDTSRIADARFVVTDEYGQVQPAGPIVVAADGSYVVSMELVASRHGSDRDGRTYSVVVIATDSAGNEGSATVSVIVPHDQRK